MFYDSELLFLRSVFEKCHVRTFVFNAENPPYEEFAYGLKKIFNTVPDFEKIHQRLSSSVHENAIFEYKDIFSCSYLFLILPETENEVFLVGPYVSEIPSRKQILEIAEKLDMPVEKVREILRVAQEPVSLETPIGDEEDSHLGDFIPDDDAPAPAEAASYTLLREQLCEVLHTLTPREEHVLKLRFGLEDGRTRTLEEVGKVFNITRERIRQIEAKALRKLRHPSRSKKLKDFID